MRPRTRDGDWPADPYAREFLRPVERCGIQVPPFLALPHGTFVYGPDAAWLSVVIGFYDRGHGYRRALQEIVERDEIGNGFGLVDIARRALEADAPAKAGNREPHLDHRDPAHEVREFECPGCPDCVPEPIAEVARLRDLLAQFTTRCPDCEGHGTGPDQSYGPDVWQDPCERCGGSGLVGREVGGRRS